MTTQELQKQKDHEDDLIRLRGFRPVDDTFMRILFRDNLPLANTDPGRKSEISEN